MKPNKIVLVLSVLLVISVAMLIHRPNRFRTRIREIEENNREPQDYLRFDRKILQREREELTRLKLVNEKLIQANKKSIDSVKRISAREQVKLKKELEWFKNRTVKELENEAERLYRNSLADSTSNR